MPAIEQQILDCTIYLYPSILAARAGESFGGSGFLVGIPAKNYDPPSLHIYAVSNSHVIREASSPIIRLNNQAGGNAVLNAASESWIHHPAGDDVAVCPLDLFDSDDKYKFKCIPTNLFVENSYIYDNFIGPGSEVFMVGRFMTHDGKQKNLPTVRFGNIAMMPWEPIRHSRGTLQESFLVECRSLSGYSGSPVFVYRPGAFQVFGNEWNVSVMEPRLLGIDWGHISHFEKVLEKNKEDPISEGWVVRSNSGMAGVVPAWKLLELLNREELAMEREKKEEQLREKQPKSPMTLDAEPIFTKSDFETALKKVGRRLPLKSGKGKK